MFSGLCRCEEQEVDYSEILKSQFQMKGENDARWNCIMEAFNLPHFQDNLKLKSIDPSNIKKINTEINRYIIKAKKQICPRSHFEVKRRSADPSMIRLIPAKHHTAAVEETEDALSYNAKGKIFDCHD